MEMQKVALSSFVVLEASWPVDQSHQLISELQPTHVIVHRAEPPQDYYYLFQADWTLAHLKWLIPLSQVGVDVVCAAA